MNKDIRGIRHSVMGKWLREARQKRGLTMLEVAKKFKMTSGQYIYNVENGQAQISVYYIKQLSKMYKVPQIVFVEKLSTLYYELLLKKIRES